MVKNLTHKARLLLVPLNKHVLNSYSIKINVTDSENKLVSRTRSMLIMLPIYL